MIEYNMTDIYPYIYSFHTNEEGLFYEEMVDDYVGSINSDFGFSYFTGCTKCVIAPENVNYVIKVPFSKFYCDELEDYVNIEQWDHCNMEYGIYRKAAAAGFSQFFLPIVPIGEFHEYPWYIQPKVNVGLICREKLIPEIQKSATISSHFEFTFINETFLALAYKILNSDNKFCQFCKFIKDNNIDQDLHNQNVGMYHGIPVAIDYAGYNISQEDWI